MRKTFGTLLSLSAAGVLCFALAGPVWAEGAGDMNSEQQQQQHRRGSDTGRPPPAIDPNVRREQQRLEEQQRRDHGAQQRAIEEQRRRNAEGNRRIEDQQRRAAEGQRRATEEQQRRQAEERQRHERSERQQRERAEQQLRDRVVQEQHRRDWDRDRRDRRDWRDRDGGRAWWGHQHPRDRFYVYVDRRPIFVAPERRRYYRDVVIMRPYGHWYTGYGRFYSDFEAYPYLGLTAITAALVAQLTEPQQRALEDAQIVATTAPIGQPINWWMQGAGGSVVATRDGWSEGGLYCREFHQTIQVFGRIEQAYGAACQQPDGAWIVTQPI